MNKSAIKRVKLPKDKIVHLGHAARMHLLAADRCSELRAKGTNEFEALLVPAIVCLAFSVELSLKYIKAREVGSFLKEHDLHILFNDLSVSTRQELEEAIAPMIFTSSVDEFLKNCARAYFKWRYYFQSEELLEMNYKCLRDVATVMVNFDQ